EVSVLSRILSCGVSTGTGGAGSVQLDGTAHQMVRAIRLRADVAALQQDAAIGVQFQCRLPGLQPDALVGLDLYRVCAGRAGVGLQQAEQDRLCRVAIGKYEGAFAAPIGGADGHLAARRYRRVAEAGRPVHQRLAARADVGQGAEGHARQGTAADSGSGFGV
ncbi:MAG: hypothetical protein AAFO08_06775, partial [Pseudomonadota bacterium]